MVPGGECSAKYVRGNAAVRVHVICREERFYQVSRRRSARSGPWLVARQGYVVIEAHMLGFEKRLKAL